MGKFTDSKHEAGEATADAKRKRDDSDAAENVRSLIATNSLSKKIDRARLLIRGDFRGAGVYTSYYAANQEK